MERDGVTIARLSRIVNHTYRDMLNKFTTCNKQIRREFEPRTRQGGAGPQSQTTASRPASHPPCARRLEQRIDDKPVSIGQRRSNECSIHLFIAQALDQFVAKALLQSQVGAKGDTTIAFISFERSTGTNMPVSSL